MQNKAARNMREQLAACACSSAARMWQVAGSLACTYLEDGVGSDESASAARAIGEGRRDGHLVHVATAHTWTTARRTSAPCTRAPPPLSRLSCVCVCVHVHAHHLQYLR